MALVLVVVPSFAVITAVKQVAYNQYEVTTTGGGAIELLDDEDQVLPSTTAGNIVTLSNWQSHANNVRRARQDGVKFMNFDTWRHLYLRASNDNTDRRQITAGKGDPNGNFQTYTPLMTVAGGTLTITAPKAAPIFNQATFESGTVLSIHKPGHSQYAYTPATGAYSVSVPLPSTYTATSRLQACALINDQERSCTEMPYNSPSPPSPPSPPPSPPMPPPRPMPPPSPLYPPFSPRTFAPSYLTTNNTWTTATFVPVGVVVALLACLGLCWYHRKKIHSAATKNKGSKLRGSAMQEVGVVPPPKAPAGLHPSSKKPAVKAEDSAATSSTKDSSEAPKGKDTDEPPVEEPAKPADEPADEAATAPAGPAADPAPESSSEPPQPVAKEESVENV